MGNSKSKKAKQINKNKIPKKNDKLLKEHETISNQNKKSLENEFSLDKNIEILFLENKFPSEKNKEKKLFIDLITDSYADDWLVNKFIVFKSMNNILYLIYANSIRSIISYDLINNKKINEIKNAHYYFITNFKHYFDNINRRDLLISISCDNKNVKLWDIYNFELILNIQNIYFNGYLESACFLTENKQNYIITCNDYNLGSDVLKVFDLKGRYAGEINNSNYSTTFLETYFDYNLSKYYIIAGNRDYIRAYDYKSKKLYKVYKDNPEDCHMYFIITNINKKTELIDPSFNGIIRIWNFHSGELLKKIKGNLKGFREFCLLNNNQIFIGCEDSTIKLIELKGGKILKELKGHKGKVLSVKIIDIPKYGKCILSKAESDDPIKLWIIKNII